MVLVMTTKTRKTKETEINLSLSLNGGIREISTGIGFFDHMLDLFSAHSGFSLIIEAKGDLNVDCHHTVEDTGIVLGQAFKDELSEYKCTIGGIQLPFNKAMPYALIEKIVHFGAAENLQLAEEKKLKSNRKRQGE
jgi:imidazoleglycerol-phosphate dehydratase